MTNLFIDCEFNGFGGQLLSMAIVDGNGNEFYQVLPAPRHIDAWVQDNVMPFLYCESISWDRFQAKLQSFLSTYKSFNLIADWPDDIKYFMEAIILAPGIMMSLPSFSCEVCRWINYKSDMPHNALEDARGIARAYKENETSRGVV